jgi:hypothetical protein
VFLNKRKDFICIPFEDSTFSGVQNKGCSIGHIIL